MGPIDKLRAILEADQHHLASSLYDPMMSASYGLTYGELRELLGELDQRRDAIGRLAKQVTEAEGKLKAAERVIEDACDAVGHGWFTESDTLAEAITVKCKALERDITTAEHEATDDAERRAFVRQAAIAFASAVDGGPANTQSCGHECLMATPAEAWGLAKELWEAKPDDC
jgi:phage shock protein A